MGEPQSAHYLAERLYVLQGMSTDSRIRDILPRCEYVVSSAMGATGVTYRIRIPGLERAWDHVCVCFF